MRKLLIAAALFFIVFGLHAQPSQNEALAKDSLQRKKAIDDSLRMESLLSKSTYPLIKSSKYSGVIPVPEATEIPDPNQQYRLLMEVTTSIKDSITAKEIHGGLAEVARLINLHVASNIPKTNLHVVAVVHGGALRALYTNEAYHKKYHIDNPNLPLLKELLNAGVKIVVCGQAMNFFDVKQSYMIPEVRVSLTAQTVLSNYQLKGFVLYQIMDLN